MIIPDAIHFLGQDWKITHEADLSDRHGNKGEIRYKVQEIALQDGQKDNAVDQYREQTFFHELLHLVLYKNGRRQA